MTRARDLARIANSNALTVDSSGNVGIGSTVPTSKLSVVGIVSASQVFASGVNLANVASGNITPTSVVISGEGATAVTINSSGINAGIATFTNLTVNGTQTIINTTSLEITDKNIGIGSTSTPSDSYADGAGITIYGTTNKTLTWDNSNSRLAFSTNVYAPKYYGDGSTLTNVSAGLALQQSGSAVVGGAATTINFSGATISNVSSGIATITIASAGLGTEALTASGITTTLNLTKQDHKVTATGITTITVSGGTEGESHTDDTKFVFPKDKSLKEKLPKWASVFIAMLVKKACETDGEVKDCPEVVSASNKYRQSQDCITAFISDKIVKDPTGSIGKRQLNDVFKEWFQMNYGNRKMPKLSDIEEIMIKKFGNRNTKTNKWMSVKFSEEEQSDDLECIEQEN